MRIITMEKSSAFSKAVMGSLKILDFCSSFVAQIQNIIYKFKHKVVVFCK